MKIKLIIYTLLIILLCVNLGKLIINPNPIVVKYNNSYYYPMLFQYSYGDFNLPHNLMVNFHDEYLIEHINKKGYIINPLWNNVYNNIILSQPNREHILGIDLHGMDYAYVIINSINNLYIMGLLPTIISLLIAMIIGILQGYFGGIYDLLLHRIYEISISIPIIYIIMFIGDFIELNTTALVIIIGIYNWTFLLPFIRKITMQLKNQQEIISLTLSKMPIYKIMYKYIAIIILNKIYPLLGFMFITNNLIVITLDFFSIGYNSEFTLGKAMLNAFNEQYWWLIYPPIIIFVILSLHIIHITKKYNTIT